MLCTSWYSNNIKDTFIDEAGSLARSRRVHTVTVECIVGTTYDYVSYISWKKYCKDQGSIWDGSILPFKSEVLADFPSFSGLVV